MKLTTFALLAAVTVFGCGGSKKTTKPPTDTSASKSKTPAKQADNKLMEQVGGDQKVSPNIALAGDIVQLCGIKAASPSANPAFDYDKADLTPEDRNVLDQLATCLTTGALKGRSVSLVGRADPRGTEEYNLSLGSRRASSVSSYLAKLGVDQPRMDVNTRGSLDATGTDEAGWAKDRRVDITLQAQGGAAPAKP